MTPLSTWDFEGHLGSQHNLASLVPNRLMSTSLCKNSVKSAQKCPKSNCLSITQKPKFKVFTTTWSKLLAVRPCKTNMKVKCFQHEMIQNIPIPKGETGWVNRNQIRLKAIRASNKSYSSIPAARGCGNRMLVSKDCNLFPYSLTGCNSWWPGSRQRRRTREGLTTSKHIRPVTHCL